MTTHQAYEYAPQALALEKLLLVASTVGRACGGRHTTSTT
jgi:hypothetical protein